MNLTPEIEETLAQAGLDETYHGLTKPPQRVKVDDVRDMVNLPDHYARFPIEPIRFIVVNKLDPLRGKVIKYTMRCDVKNGREDIRKAIRCLQMFDRCFFEDDGTPKGIYHPEGDVDPDWWKVGHN